jgi:hypothetical protein
MMWCYQILNVVFNGLLNPVNTIAPCSPRPPYEKPARPILYFSWLKYLHVDDVLFELVAAVGEVFEHVIACRCR